LEITATEKLSRNRAFQGKLSWKRKEAMQIKESIKDFVSDNFNIDLPLNYPIYKKHMQNNYNTENYTALREEYKEIISLYYQFNYCGQSFASIFEDVKGRVETYTLAHTYSKHRFDPVWNMRKSNLIRNIYRKYLQETKIYNSFHPVHITLTLPHLGGKFQGKDFYANELITAFNLIRKKEFWKKSTFGGEYGVEVKESKNKENGLHIHIHSLTFLKVKDVNKFRKQLKEAWEKQTGGNQIWVETVYFHKKDDSGKYITEIKDSAKLKTFEDTDGTYMSEPEERTVVRKKFYVDREAKEIQKRKDLTPEEKEETILNFYLKAILETIKYHFKFDAIKNDDVVSEGKTYKSEGYNVDLINNILKNTKKKRLYSRFGKFYKVDALNFNNLGKKEATEAEPMAEAAQIAVNPFTLEEIPVEQTQIVMFYPERQKRQPKNSMFPFELINYKQTEFYTYLEPNQNIKKVLENHFNALFNRSALDILHNKFKAKKNKGHKADYTLPEKIPDKDLQNSFNFDTDSLNFFYE